MNKYTFEGIQYFITIAQMGSIRLASNELGVEQKTIRHKIKMLEQHLGITLIESSSKGSSLTDKGWEVHGALAQDFQGLTNKVSVISKGKNPTHRTEKFRILLPPFTANFFSLYIIPELYRKFPEIHVELISFNLKHMLFYGSQLKNIINNMDMLCLDNRALSIIHPDEWSIVSRYIEKLYLHTSKAYLEKVGPIDSIKDLDGLDFIGKAGIHDQNGDIIILNNKTGTESKINFNVIFNADTEINKAYLVSNGLGISMLGRGTVHNVSLHKDLDIIPILKDYTNKTYIDISCLVKNNFTKHKYVKETTAIIKNLLTTLPNLDE